MKFSNSTRLLLFSGAISIAVAGVWLLIAVSREEAPLKPWNSPFTTTTKPAVTAGAAPLSEAASPGSISKPESSPAIATLPSPPAPVLSSPPPDSTHQPESTESVAEPKLQPVSTASTPAQNQVEGSRRMYQAHAPLRTASFADPDSVENRRALQTMVTKALAK